MLIIKMFGNSQYGINAMNLYPNKTHSIQLTTLISYLIANKDTEIPVKNL